MRSATPSTRSRPLLACPSGRRSATRTEDARGFEPGSSRWSARSLDDDPRPHRDRGDPAPQAAVPAHRRGRRARARRARRRAQARHRGGLRGPLPGEPDHARREDGRGARAGGRGRGARRGAEPRQARTLRGDRRRALQAHRPSGRGADADLRPRDRARADRARQGARDGGRRPRRPRHADLRGGVVIGTANGRPISITGLGCYVPDRVLSNDDLAQMVDTSDEWIVERTGIRERRIAAPEQAMSDLALPACERALEQAGLTGADLDLIIMATVTPDMAFPATAAILGDLLGAKDAACYDLSAGCTGFMYALAQGYGMLAGGLAERALVVGGDVLSKILDWTDRSTLILFGEGAGGVHLWLPGSGSRHFEDPEKFVKMNGREVFKFATRVLVSSAEKVLRECGKSVEEVDVYVPHQANVRIIDHAARKLGIPEERVVVNVDRYGNTSSGSIPLALADAETDGLLREGSLVLMTGMGAGLTWGSSLLLWTNGAMIAP